MTETAQTQQIPPPTRRDWIAILSAILGAFMAILDIQIINSSLKDIQGALSATIEEGSWISTSYLVAEIIIIPLAAWLAMVMSPRRFAVAISITFVIASLLCSMAWNLESMIVFRVLQGLAGGALIPFAFSLVLTKLPLDVRPKGMALFAITATFAPSIGPTIGGWLTENYGWEFIFYINIVPGVLMTLGLLYGLDKSEPRWELLKKGDYAGILSMAIGLGCLQVFLEEGQREDWFESAEITWLASIAFVSLVIFIILQLSRDNHLVNLRLFKERNFLLGSLANIGLGVGLYGTVFILPLYLAQIQDYNALQIGQVIMWMGLPQLLLIPLVPVMMRYIDPRLICALGLALFGLGSFLSGSLNLDFAGDQFIAIQIIRACGQPMVLVPLSIIATAMLPPSQAGSASSLYNILRNLGGAIGIAALATILDSRAAHYFEILRSHVSLGNPAAAERLALLGEQLGSSEAALRMLDAQVREQAQIMAYNDAFHLIGIMLACSVLCIMLTKALPKALGKP
ncbi:DHA2 family efflux MFS transporter permease subunit [Halopseudomonas bauzanensis]|uniref:MFS transporter, DHA2 family, multidrug resistance protein n=1 Tax=Halopseudomonas bauzanensis TaxID=653930 RepID=A0A1H9VIS4_9GAMM|nr:DHA2 family efflux MFS transporter permease subunit [Halopseudomonas bauzanensis]SES21401.1 MFS transporter, DHA2 family, multidrug resistance protein [Halopseudomonas bauzanensis]SFM14723.1 MFS transporter, DHA2 family, multidrug resistance protein [Halopseudomonas bauzanensis]